MALSGVDDEILQDFLVEAGEILETLSEQLVELEANPSDNNLLNAIFRGFHTVKGGAGFLSLTNLVEVCHVAENVFDLLRQGKRSVDPDLMDVVLKTLDCVNDMFSKIREGNNPDKAPEILIEQLTILAAGGYLGGTAPAPAAHTAEKPKPQSILEELEEELAVAAAPTTPMAAPVAAPIPVPASAPDPAVKIAASGGGDGLITDDEFEQYLDALQGNAGPAKTIPPKPVAVTPTAVAPKPVTPAAGSSNDLITDAEFENLLDELQGSGPKKVSAPQPAPPLKPVVVSASSPVAQAVAAAPKPLPVAMPKPVPVAAPAAHHDDDHKLKDNKDNKDKEKELAAETTVRVDTSRLDEIMNMVGELVLVRNRLVKLKGDTNDEGMSKAVSNLDVVTADLQMAVMKTRMQPIKKVFGRFPRVVRDLARNLKKEVVLDMEGEETDLDKNLVEALSDPLVHLVRNSVDHGVENPEERLAAGKPRAGKILLAAEQAGDHILLSIRDDGKGMDHEVLRQKVVEKGLMDQDVAARLDAKECFNLIFLPGFSTKDQISDVSGRGVGMDVVKTKISQLNGTVDIDSVKGQGTRISIKVPLTLAILPTLMVVVGDQTFALPLTSVNEIFHLDIRKTNIVDGQLVVVIREKAVPLFYLSDWLNHGSSRNRPDDNMAHVVIVSMGTQRVGFVVDGLLGQEEVVIKSLGDMLQGTPGMAGATITGDGRIAMILDVPGLLKRYAKRSA
ncbi:MAG: chemotaxis protein CheW [Gammaproteobacteria bacterium]